MADITRYLNLITSEHSDKPKFKSMLTNVLDEIDIGVDIDGEFDIDNAVGVQLDIIGEILGLSRVLTFQPSDGSALLNDDDYRSLLYAKIILNQWDGSMETLTDALLKLDTSLYFIVKDNQDMSLDVTAIGTDQLKKELLSNGYVIPKPAGVRINYTMSETVVFAYDSDTSALAGYDIGSWVQEG
jgi:hypothetical protein